MVHYIRVKQQLNIKMPMLPLFGSIATMVLSCLFIANKSRMHITNVAKITTRKVNIGTNTSNRPTILVKPIIESIIIFVTFKMLSWRSFFFLCCLTASMYLLKSNGPSSDTLASYETFSSLPCLRYRSNVILFTTWGIDKHTDRYWKVCSHLCRLPNPNIPEKRPLITRSGQWYPCCML